MELNNDFVPDEREAPSELFELGEAAEGVNLFGSMGAVPNKLGASLEIAAGKRYEQARYH